MYGDGEVESLCQLFDIDSLCTVILALQTVQRLRWKRHPDELKQLFVAVNSILISSAQCECGC